MKSVSCIIPVYNNAATLAELAKQLFDAAQRIEYKVAFVFVDDGSTDDSKLVLQQLKYQYTDTTIIQLTENCGQSVALIIGLANATHEISICLDADLQDPPAAIEILLAEINTRKTDVVFAGRTGKYESGSRHLSAHIFKQLFSMLTGGAIPPNAGLFFAIQTRSAAGFIEYAGSRPYMLALMFQLGLSCSTIPVQRHHRPGGGSGYTTWKRWKTGVKGLISLMPMRKEKLPEHIIRIL
jgi:glycosyltransferase involved in cell wall biosynthesis